MNEIIVNLHMHTGYSDGHGSHADIVQAALRAGLDAVIVTDHNVWVEGFENYYEEEKRRVLLLVGEEIHDQARDPQKNHLLVVGAEKELAQYAYDLPLLLNMVRKSGGLAFAAHPVDPAAPAIGETDISWVDLEQPGLTGIEIWNSFSEFKGLLKSKLHAIFYVYTPQRIAQGPYPEALAKWDALLMKGRKVAAVGGSDAHALKLSLGPLHRTVFPYEFHFHGINNHLLIPNPLTGEINTDKRMILEALARGRNFVGYDAPAPTRGFKFTAQGMDSNARMGDEISSKHGVTLQIRLPRRTNCRLIRHGKTLKTWSNQETCTYITTEPGAYRVEASIDYQGRQRGWIYSNPIYVI